MSFETDPLFDDFPEMTGQLRDRTPLLHRSISLDGVVPVSEVAVAKQGARRQQSYLIYDAQSLAGEQFVYPTQKIRKYALPTVSPLNREDAVQGVSYAVQWDTETEDITHFDIRFRPDIQRQDLPLLLSIAHARHESFEDLGKRVLELLPECRIDSDEGISLFADGEVVFAYGPGYPIPADSEGEENEHPLYLFSRPNSAVTEVTVEFPIIYFRSEKEIESAYPELLEIFGGMTIYEPHFETLKLACTDLLKQHSSGMKKLDTLIKPYYGLREVSPDDMQDDD